MDNFDKLYNKALHFLSFRPRSEKEIRDFLLKKVSKPKSQTIIKSKEQEYVEAVIVKLKRYKFIDDIEFTKWWIEQRTRIKPRAFKFIKFELKLKGISDETIDLVTSDDQFQKTSDIDSALKLAKKRMERLRNEIPQKRFEKMFRYLSAKGYDYNTIKQVIDQILGKEYN
jgi:regulatory protein